MDRASKYLDQSNQRQAASHDLVEFNPTITEYPVLSYVLFTPPVQRSDKLLPRQRGPFQVLDRTNSIYTIEDLVSDKRSSIHIHNLRPFHYDPVPTRTGVRRGVNHQPPRQLQPKVDNEVQSPMDWIRRVPLARRQATRLSESQYHEDPHLQGTKVDVRRI